MARPLSFFGRLFAPRVHVSRTNIFARMIAPGVQALAYGMNLESAREVAMILPLPVVPGSGDHAVTFVSLEAEPRMFADLAELFAPPVQTFAKGGISRGGPSRQRLVVHEVGAFVASYVPTRADFARLDPRFRMPEVLFDAVPHYADYGFAVFQLAPGKVTVHPMAMTFPTRSTELFFPTVHVHDGRFHATARFDHALYYQGEVARGDEIGWGRPTKPYANLVLVEQPIARRTLRARLANADVWIAAT